MSLDALPTVERPHVKGPQEDEASSHTREEETGPDSWAQMRSGIPGLPSRITQSLSSKRASILPKPMVSPSLRNCLLILLLLIQV